MSTAELTAESISDLRTLDDTELIERFVVDREEAAFAELVRRHASVVLNVCRRVLRDRHDVEDVFQATFLVLVRDASRIRDRKSIGCWLYGVAHRLSIHLCRQRQRRRETVLTDDLLTGDDLLRTVIVRHNQQQLDLELDRLPERYRHPLILRFLAGKTCSEVATELGMSVGTVEGLVKRGKAVLRKRLVRQGITLSAAGLTILALQQPVSAALVSETLTQGTIESAITGELGTHGLSADLLSGLALDLVGKEVLVMTTATKSALAIGITAAGLVVGIGGFNLLTTHQGGHAQAAGPIERLGTLNAVNEDVEFSLMAADPAPQVESASQSLTEDLTSSIISSETSGSISVSGNMAAGIQGSRIPWDFKTRSKKIAQIEQQLQTSTEVNFTDIPLKDALDFLEEVHHIDIWVDQKVLSEEGISTDQTVFLAISGLSLKSTLRLLLDPLNLDYVIRNDVLEITTRSKADEKFETRVYNLNLLPSLTAKELQEIITTTIEPQSWRSTEGTRATKVTESAVIGTTSASGGSVVSAVPGAGNGGGGGGPEPEGSIRATQKSLVIRQNQRIHDLIVDLLDQLQNEK